MQRILSIRSGRHPHEVLILLAAVIIGIAGLIAPESISASMTAVFDIVGARVFYAGMLSFAGTGLYGLWKREVEGLMIERSSLIALTFFFTAYALAVIFNAGWAGMISATLPLAFAVANVARITQIRYDLIYTKAYLTDESPECQGG